MLLAFDVGNTNIVCGVYKERKLIRHWRVATDTLQTADGYAALLGTLFQLSGLAFKDVEDIIISTVVPPIIPILETMSQRYFHTKPIMVVLGSRQVLISCMTIQRNWVPTVLSMLWPLLQNMTAPSLLLIWALLPLSAW